MSAASMSRYMTSLSYYSSISLIILNLLLGDCDWFLKVKIEKNLGVIKKIVNSDFPVLSHCNDSFRLKLINHLDAVSAYDRANPTLND